MDFIHDNIHYIKPYTNLGLVTLLTTINQPIVFAKTLKTFEFNPFNSSDASKMISIDKIGNISYTRQIFSTTSFSNLYTGFSSRLVGNLIFEALEPKFLHLFCKMDGSKTYKGGIFDDGSQAENEHPKLYHYIFACIRKFISNVLTTVICQPFYVISTRLMFTSVFSPSFPTSLFSIIKEIATSEGFLGFFNGLAEQIQFASYCMLLTFLMYSLYMLIPKFEINIDFKNKVFMLLLMASSLRFGELDKRATSSRINGSVRSRLIKSTFSSSYLWPFWK